MFQEIAILLPCHSFEDFPTYHTGDDAQSVLANWTAMWHPAFLAVAGKKPQWYRVDTPPEKLEGLALLIPTICKSDLPAGFTQRAKESGGTIIKGLTDRTEIVAKLLAAAPSADPLAQELSADFFALGYCYLQVELLTRQMRYSSSLDEIYFEKKLIEAAQAAASGDATEAQQALQACFDVLMEERNQYYSVEACLLDFTLCAETTLGEALQAEVEGEVPVNLWVSGVLAQKIAAEHPLLNQAIRQRLESGKVGLVGGELVEGPLNLLDPEALLENLQRGHAAYEQSFGAAPRVFGRRRFGMTAFLPQVLRGLGYAGAIHATLDEGKLPVSNQGKVRWEGVDGSTIDALAKFPLDATKAETFLSLFTKLGEAMDGEHVATLAFAHWPGITSPWYDDLKTIARYGATLGSFMTVETYFEDTDVATYHGHFKPEDYRTPWLKQSIVRRQPGPVSQHAQRELQNAQTEAAAKLSALARLVSGARQSPNAARPERSVHDPADPADADSLQSEALVAEAQQELIKALPRTTDPASPAYVVFNPWNAVSTRGVFLPELPQLPVGGDPVIAEGQDAGRKFAAIDVPGTGYAWVVGDPRGGTVKHKTLLEGNILRNEHMEVHIHPETGGIKSIYDYRTRGNRLSQQLSLRTPGPKQATGTAYQGPDASAVYTRMVVSEIRQGANTPALGEIHTTGTLVNEEQETVATYHQTYRLWRASRVLEIDLELQPQVDPKSLPWDSHYCCRLAWGDESAATYHDVQWVRTRCSGRRIEASNYVEIETTHGKTTLLTAGIPYHLRNHGHMLDTILIPHGEPQRKFRLGIGLDLPYSFPAARSFLYQPPPLLESASMPSAGKSSWLFHLEARNVTMTTLDPLTGPAGDVIGFSTRVLETEGRVAKGAIRCFRKVREAHLCDFQGNRISRCEVEGERVRFQLAPGQWYPIEVEWE